MSRPRRICFEGAVYHVTCRGDNQEPVFVDEADFQQYLLYLRRYKQQLQFLFYCYCLMPNHVHLVLETPSSATISKIMHCVNSRYTQYFNRRNGRVGHLFQGRFHSRLIEKDSYLLAVSRYIHLNPLKANLCSRPQDYAWSSYPAYLSKTNDALRLVDCDTILGMVSTRQEEQSQRYQEFVEASSEHDEPRRYALEHLSLLGSQQFIHDIHERFGLNLRPQGRPKKLLAA